jgi:lysophospholipase L1-like esterase
MTQLYTFIYLLRYFLILYFATTATPSAAQYKIMALGNSITQGNLDHPGYKYKLWQMLIDANADVELVGSHDVNEGGSPAVKGTTYKGKTYTNRNEGHWGWSADEILNGRDGKGNLSEWLQGYTPDIVLMHLGTNDMFRQCTSSACYQETIEELKEVVRRIRLKNPNAVLLVAKLIPAYDQKVGPEAANNISRLNEMIPAMVDELNTETSPVVLVDQNTGFDPTTGIDTHDGVHPNASGELKMAENWFAAIGPYITPQPVELTSFKAAATSFGPIQLTWRTASEKDNAYFEIQRSTNQTDYEPLGQVKGAGTTQIAQAYSFDDSTATGGSLYYRLLQVDFDGSSSYSKVVYVERELKGEKLQVYPTSSDGGQHVTVHLQQQQPGSEVEVSIITSSGKLVKQFTKRVSSAGSLLEKVKVHDLQGAGLYFVHVLSGGQQLQGEFLLTE